MKSIKKTTLLILSFSLLSSLCLSLTAEKDTKSFNLRDMLSEGLSEKDSSFLSKGGLAAPLASPLFKPGTNICKDKKNLEHLFTNSFPKRKKNPYSALNLNRGPVAYFMDYLEDAFRLQNKLIQSIFKSIFEDVKAQTAPADFKDPYPLLKLATGNPTTTETLANEERDILK